MTDQPTPTKGPAMPDHAELAESATAAAQAALDPMHPDPAELAILATSHWLGAIHEVLRETFAPVDPTSFDGDPTVEQQRPDLDRHARETALLRDDR